MIIAILFRMPVKLVKKQLEDEHFQFNAFAFLPEKPYKDIGALFTHGYTASKTDNISWAQRLSEMGCPSVIFDLPGHHLGSLSEVKSFESFRDHSHETFVTAWHFLKECFHEEINHIVLGGHSLGAMLALKALILPEFQDKKTMAIGVGLGIGQHKTTHLFETAFYERTLNIRRQLVSEKIDSDLVFPWIKEEKLNVNLRNKRIHLITGKDDLVVGEGGMEALAFNLRNLDNEVTTHEPTKLPHHEPGLASSHIFHFLKKEFHW